MYVAVSIFIPLQYPGYHFATQTVSEISAIGAPTRQLWVNWLLVYSALVLAFGVGILLVARGRTKGHTHGRRPLQVVGILVILNTIVGVFWPPMHQREVLAAGGGNVSDTLHIVFTAITVLLFLLTFSFGAAAFGKGFRWYSLITLLVMLVTGILTSLQAPDMQANLPTPTIGIWERIGIAGYMIWMLVLSVMLVRDTLRVTTPLPA